MNGAREVPGSVFVALVVFAIGIHCTVAQSSHAASGCEVVYRLTEKADYQEGCFPPCMCPILFTDQIRGTFVMGPIQPGAQFSSREVKFVNWIVTRGEEEFEIRGSGVYRFEDDFETGDHSLDLLLRIDGAGPKLFFSGWVPRSSSGGSIDIPISINGQYCYDTVITVNAKPVENDSLLRYSLAADSTYQRSCTAPCNCPAESPRGLQGSLVLTPILEYGTYVEYGVPWADFSVPPLSDLENEIGFRGYGTYTLIQGFAGPAHVFDLCLRENNSQRGRYQNELTNTDPTFPAEFQVVVEKQDQTCIDTVLSIHAVRQESLIFEDGFECGDENGWVASTR